ncbi:U3 small nucleolar RNA-associated protein 15-like protein [Operophtera brumata]|uniref:U3 small nucleolar RNA-associated protein 15 homolog n=1 Tax=Operophtera brumata TaxID=104452 RepID=A0A0L7KQ42_OPEBR|nr:U3 small nucleolar RNA-associated protein 15-like protein [Operophtera brumata]
MSQPSFPHKITNTTVFKKPASVLTQDAIYWRNLGSPVLIKEFGAIDYLDFSPVEPHYFAATCSARVQIYDPITKIVAKNINKFAQAAYGCTFRADGRLVVAGSEEGAVKLFDVASKKELRVFHGHSGPVHRTYFAKDQVSVLSFSDDKSAGVWDIATEKKVANYTEHTDYLRAGAPSPISSNIFASGSYDHTVKLFDSRTSDSVLTVNHGSPVEATLFLPSGGIFISAGGTEIKVWDIFNSGKLLANISQHHKTVTSLCLASNNSRLMSGSLDRHVKIYDIGTFKTIHNIDYPNAVLSMAISAKDDILAVGMIDGIISIRKRETLARQTGKKKGFYKFAPDNFGKERKTSSKIDTVVRGNNAKVMVPPHESHLRKMEFSKALSCVVVPSTLKHHPQIAAALMQEMLRRKVLHVAMEDLSESEIVYLVTFFRKYMGDSRFTRIIIDAANVFLDVYEQDINSFNRYVVSMYNKLLKMIKKEIRACNEICELEGALSMLLASAQVGADVDADIVSYSDITPSSNALKDMVIDV